MNSLIILLIGLILRCLVSLWPHSGQSTPPMYGDYEAQRHWMELTVNTPLNEWYSTDLEYWGLDYPPGTAYHSYLMGHVAQKVGNKSWVEWKASRGMEHDAHRLFMRLTVLVADLLVFFPAVVIFYQGINFREKENLISLAICYPGLILIDHGHFQYNCISLGLTMLAVACISKNRFILSTVFFSIALNYKQMSLYHSLPFFVYLLKQCINQKSVSLFAKLSITVLITFLIFWAPFASVYLQVLHRLFPIARGVFEDKVANFWCVINVILKLKNYPQELLVKICTLVTFIGCIPSLCHLFLTPNLRNFHLSLINVSLSFFLFSFQVHEKSILLPAVSVLIYLPHNKFPCVWFLLISLFSMVHLFQKDLLLIPFLSLFLAYLLIAKALDCLKVTFMFLVSLIGCGILFSLLVTTPPPTNLPDFWPLLIAIYSCLHFGLFFLYFNYKQICSK